LWERFSTAIYSVWEILINEVSYERADDRNRKSDPSSSDRAGLCRGKHAEGGKKRRWEGEKVRLNQDRRQRAEDRFQRTEEKRQLFVIGY
jgi:hypothetical protein